MRIFCTIQLFPQFFTWNDPDAYPYELNPELNPNNPNGKCGIRCFQPGPAVNARTQMTGLKGSADILPNKVYVAKTLGIVSRRSCQSVCQSDSQCQSVGFFGPNSDNPNICVLNYGPTIRNLRLGSASDTASAPKSCP